VSVPFLSPFNVEAIAAEAFIGHPPAIYLEPTHSKDPPMNRFWTKAILVAVISFLASPVLAQSPWSSSPNAFGGQNFSNGGYSTPNAFGGQNYRAPGGGTVTSTPNVFGGQNYSNGWSSRSNVFGGQNFNGPNGQSFSTSRNAFGGQNFSNGGHTTPNASGGWSFWGR
jgi:hypothetical protein